MVLEEMDSHFNELADITDRVALVNSHYDSNLEKSFGEMESNVKTAMSWDLESMSREMRQVFMSHMSFHREIIAEIIAEARKLLIEERRAYLKRLVAYHKDFSTWLNRVEKKYAA